MPTKNSFSELNEHLDSPLPVAAGASKEDREISLLDLLIVLVEHKRQILWITAVSTILAILTSLLLPQWYTATVMLLPPQQNASISTGLTAQFGNLGAMAALANGNFGLKNPNDRFVGMLKSRTVEDAMIQRFGLMEEYHTRFLADARKKFEHHSDVDGDAKDGMIHISIEDRNPQRAAELANGFVDQFRSLSEHLAITEASQRRLFFEQQLVRAKDTLTKAEEALKLTQQTTGVIQLDSQARVLIETAAALRAQITAREVQIQGMQTYAAGENSQLVQAQRELESLRAQLARLGGSEDAASSELMVPKGRVTEAGLEYIRRLRDVKYNETMFEILARQFELAKLDEAKEGALIQVVDAAIPPDKRSFPKRVLLVLGSAIAGLLIGICVAFLSAGWKYLNSIHDSHAKILYLKRILSWRAPSAS